MNTSRILLALAPALLVAACGGGDDSLDDRIDAADPKVRFVHAAPAGPDVTLSRDGTAQADATDVGYRYASTYFDVSTDTADWRVATAPADATIETIRLDSRRGNKYTFVALLDTTGADVVLIDDPYNKSVASDDARVRVVNASLNAQNVDAYVTAPGTNLATVNPNFGGVGFKQSMPASGADSAEFEGATYQLTITTAGSKTPIFTAPITPPRNADWLLMTVPGGLTANDIRVLVVNADDPSRVAVELASQ